MSDEAQDTPETAGQDAQPAEAQAAPDDIADALEFSRGEIDDEDLSLLEQGVDGIDFATRKATPERLARLEALAARLSDLCQQVKQGKRTPRAALAPLTAEEEARYTTLVEEGLAAGERGNLEQARGKLEDAVLLDPEGIGALYNLGVLYGLLAHMNVARGEFIVDDHTTRDELFLEKAQACYDKVLELQEDHLPSLNNLATLYAMRDENDLAIEVLQRMQKVSPKDDADKKYLEQAKRQLEELQSF